MPNLEEILPELNNAKYFSKIDLLEGYDQIELDLSSRHVTAFITHGGEFQLKRSVYGAKPAFESFQKILKQTIAWRPGTRSISDDILIWSSSIDELKERLNKFIDTKKQKNQTGKTDLNQKAKNKQYIDQKRRAKEIALEKGDVVYWQRICTKEAKYSQIS